MSILQEMANLQMIKKAEEFATKKHEGQIRKDGRPYIVHPKAVAELVKTYGGDAEQISTGWLHDTLEDTKTTYEELVQEFNQIIADYVHYLTNPKDLDKSKKSEFIIKKLNTMPLDVVMIKLCDRLDNVSDFKTADPNFVRSYKQETQKVLDGLDRNFTSQQQKIIAQIQSTIDRY